MVKRTRPGLIGAPVALALCLAALVLPPSALARDAVLAKGQRGPFAWSITARVAQVGHPARRGYCIEFGVRLPRRHASTGGGVCLNHGDPRANGTSGVINAGSAAAFPQAGAPSRLVGVRAILELVDPRAARVVIALNSGRVLRAPTHLLPPRLHAGARLAWVVQAGNWKVLNSHRAAVRRVVAYDAAGHVVGRF